MLIWNSAGHLLAEGQLSVRDRDGHFDRVVARIIRDRNQVAVRIRQRDGRIDRGSLRAGHINDRCVVDRIGRDDDQHGAAGRECGLAADVTEVVDVDLQNGIARIGRRGAESQSVQGIVDIGQRSA